MAPPPTMDDDGLAKELSADAIEKLLQPFTRVGGTAAAAGAGLGLSISKDLASALGGELTASRGGEGQGATSTLTLPLLGPPPAAAI